MKKFFCFLFLLITIFAINLANVEKASAATNTTLKTFMYTATTSSTGYFSVAHGIDTDNYMIIGITVAIQHANDNWHTLEYSNSVTNSFLWDETYVKGIIKSSNFASQSVSILVFTYAI